MDKLLSIIILSLCVRTLFVTDPFVLDMSKLLDYWHSVNAIY